MKISKLFHWLYATLLFLPVAVLPVFAIYSRNENAQFGYEVTQVVNKAVDFNQIAHQRVEGDSFTVFQTTYTFLNNGIQLSGTPTGDSTLVFLLQNEQNASHKYLYSGFNTNVNNEYGTGFNQNTNITQDFINGLMGNFTLSVKVGADLSSNPIILYPQCFDLTDIFGSGNEPTTVQQFRQYFPNSYYPYTESEEVVIQNYETITYNDTDIGSQMVYTLYNTVDKYFNMSSIFGMDGIGDWILFNILNNNYVLGFTIFWDLLVYWLFISIFWLIFDLMLYVPNLVHRWLDKGALE